jgi:dihydrofolate synthase/folylpolyglutamate synthase
LEWNISVEAVRKGLENVVKNTHLQGRWQLLHHKPLIICDTGHNEAGIELVVSQLKHCKFEKLFVVFGMVNDKERSKVLQLLPQTAYYLFAKANIPRGLDAQILYNEASEIGLKGKPAKSVKNAINEAQTLANDNDLIFIGGSTFVVAEALPFFKSVI